MGTYVPPAPQNFIDKQGPVVGAAWLNAIDSVLRGNVPASGVYNAGFVSGQVQLTGPNGLMTSYGDLTFGLSVPGPSPFGPAPTLIIGGAGKSVAQITTDAQIPGLGGLNLYIAAGNSDPSGTTTGGAMRTIGGASWGGRAGDNIVQAGTSVHGLAGDVQLLGGNNTSGDGAAGNVFILAGTSGNAGGSVKIYATNLNNIAGDISFWLGQPDAPHSVPLWTMSHTGALFPANSGAGNPGDVLVSAGNLASPSWGPPGSRGSLGMTMSGSMTVTPAPIKYCTDGRQVSLWSEGQISGASTGFSDLILSPLPGFLIPSLDRYVPCSMLLDNGIAQYQGMAHVDTFGGVTLSLINMTGHVQAILNAFTAGGQKGVTTGWCITYPL